MRNIYLKTTAALIVISGTLMAIGIRPPQQAAAGKAKMNPAPSSVVAQLDR
jgi:hypothetical protein